MLRNNFFYILLGFIAIILIGLTITLQLMLFGRPAEQPTVAETRSVEQSSTVDSERLSQADGADEQAVSMVINTPTSTPVVVTIQSAGSANNSVSAPVEPTSTVVLQAVSEQSASEQAPTAEAVVPIAATSTSAAPVETAIPIAATSTSVVPADFVFAYIEGRAECNLITDIVVELFDEWDWSTQRIRFSNIEKIFDNTLYEGDDAARPDLTLCYRDPEDREHFLAQNGTDLELISSGYTKINEQRYYILAHSSVPVQLRYTNTCVLSFLRELEIDSSTLANASNAPEWIAQNIDLVQSWGSCDAGIK